MAKTEAYVEEVVVGCDHVSVLLSLDSLNWLKVKCRVGDSVEVGV